MRILIIADEIWNDQVHGNNVLTNWFEGFPAEFAMVCCSPGEPSNKVCSKYFQMTDKEMVGSMLGKGKAGRTIYKDCSQVQQKGAYVSTDVANLGFLRKHMGNLLRTMKTIVWNHGKINEPLLAEFVKEFQPDIIFSVRFANSKILRIEKIVKRMANCPLVAFTGDNEYSLRRFSLAPLFWINLLYQRSYLRRMMPEYALYYSLSEQQIEEYHRHFDVDMKILRKCATLEVQEPTNEVHEPIRMVYGGKLYEGRDNTLVALAKTIQKINKDTVKLRMDIYTGSEVTGEKAAVLNDGHSTFLHAPIPAAELMQVYADSDVALCAESFRLTNRLTTRVSFSTKIIDCLQSGCAVMMIAWKEQAGYMYLEKEDAAICVDSLENVEGILRELVEKPEIVVEYRRKALQCLMKNHRREAVQENILNDFKAIVKG